ncbi:MAG: outer membrane channel protein [bacterium]|nr:MAG: outer membrane channel protein [bacterium]
MISGKKLITFFLFLAFGAASLIFVSPAQAKETVFQKGDAKLKLGARFQSRLRLSSTAEAVDSTTGLPAVGGAVNDSTIGRDYQFDFRRARIIMAGQVNKFMSFMAQTDIGNGTGQAASGAVEWRDAVVTLNFSKAAKVSFGLFKLQFTRSRNGSGFGQMALDRPLPESMSTATSSVDGSIGGKRDQQIVLWGNKNKFQYRVGIGDGETTIGGKTDTFRLTGRVHYAFWDKEQGLGYKETYLGKKNILTIGAGFDSQADVNTDNSGNATGNTAVTLDVTYEKPLANGNVVNANFAYYSRDDGNDASTSKGSGLHLTAGYKMGQWFPYLRYATWDAKPANSDETRINLGTNYLIKGHHAKIVFDLESIDYEVDGATKATKDHTVVTMQWQMDF